MEETARRVGNYKWAETKLFEVLGGWIATAEILYFAYYIVLKIDINMHIIMAGVSADADFFTHRVQVDRGIFQTAAILKPFSQQTAVIFYNQFIHVSKSKIRPGLKYNCVL